MATKHRHGFKCAMRRLADRPFATALASLLLMGTIAGLAGASLSTDALEGLVSAYFLKFLLVCYGAGGLLVLLGMAWPRSNIEAAGCVLTASGLIIRAVALVYVLGPNVRTVTSALFYLIFTWACAERFRQIIHEDKIVRIHNGVSLKFVGEDEADAGGD